jgi:hypothetical protein
VACSCCMEWPTPSCSDAVRRNCSRLPNESPAEHTNNTIKRSTCIAQVRQEDTTRCSMEDGSNQHKRCAASITCQAALTLSAFHAPGPGQAWHLLAGASTSSSTILLNYHFSPTLPGRALWLPTSQTHQCSPFSPKDERVCIQAAPTLPSGLWLLTTHQCGTQLRISTAGWGFDPTHPPCAENLPPPPGTQTHLVSGQTLPQVA